MADTKISALPAATTPLAGTEVLPIVQSSVTVKVSADNLTVKNIRSNATTGILQVTGPAASSTRVATVPDANFTVARTDAAQTFTGNQRINGFLGVDVASSSWSAGSAIDLGLGTAIFNPGSTGQTWFYTNAYFNGGAKFKAAGEATWYQQVAGAHTWYSSAAGAAPGDPITFVQTGTLDGSGNFTITGATATKASGLTWANPSDIRLKDNIQDYAKGSAELMKVRVCEWEYNGKGGTTQGMKGLGVIADEVMAVLPNSVENYKAKLNAEDEEVTEIKKFDATEITWLLVKTVQEQQATIAALTARVATLESA
jgi:hypothetical protein